MAIVQEAFFIPDDIATGLATGLYKRNGSVVRYAVAPNKGQIVKHLDTIDLNESQQVQNLAAKTLQFVQQHKKGVGIAATGATIIGVGVWGYNKWKNHEPKVLTEFKEDLRVYIEAICIGNMSFEKIDKLMIVLEKMKKHKNYDEISIQLTTEELEVLVGLIYEYTIKLATDNTVELNYEELRTCDNKNSCAIIDLQKYLKIQKRIFETAV